MRTTVRWLRSIDEIERAAGTLRSLADTAERALPGADPDFIGCYVRHFEYAAEPPIPEVAVVERNGAPIGFLATRVGLQNVAPGVSVRQRTLLVTHDHDRVNMVCAPKENDEVATALAGALLASDSPTALDMAGLEVGSPLHRALHAYAKQSRSWSAYDVAIPPFCSVPVEWQSVGEYFQALSKSMRSNVSRQARRLFAAGHVELLRATGSSDVAPLLGAYLDLEQRSWKYPMQAGILRSPKRTAFFADVAAGRCAYDPSMVGVVLDGELIAALLLGRFGNGMWALEMCFDEDRKELGAGQVLLLMAMHEAIGRRCVSVGYLQHFAYFKSRWLAKETLVVSTRVVRRGSPLHVRHLLGEIDRWREARRSLDSPARPGPESDSNRVVQGLASPERESATTTPNATEADVRLRRLPDAAEASRRLLAGALMPGVLVDRATAVELLPFSLR